MNNGLFMAFLLFRDSKDETITLVSVMYVFGIHKTVDNFMEIPSKTMLMSEYLANEK